MWQILKDDVWKVDGSSGALAPVVKGSSPQFAAGYRSIISPPVGE